MTTTTALPKGMALIETDEGYYFAAFAPVPVEKPHWVVILDGPTCIPPALGEPADGRPGYASREEAIEAYRAWQEAAVLSVHWQMLAAHTEVYPERTAWYLDAITQLTGDTAPHLSCGMDVFGVVLAENCGEAMTHVSLGSQAAITATGATPDEAIEALYQQVYVWYCAQEALGGEAMTHLSLQEQEAAWGRAQEALYQRAS